MFWKSWRDGHKIRAPDDPATGHRLFSHREPFWLFRHPMKCRTRFPNSPFPTASTAAHLARHDYAVSEALLISRVLEGDRLAGRELYDAYASGIYRLAYRMTSDDEMARECTQDTFVRAFAKLGTFRQQSALGTWIHRIAVSTVLEALRSHRRRNSRLVDLDEARNAACMNDAGDATLAELLGKALDELPEIYRTALIMHDLEGYTHSAIAEILEIAEGTSKTRLAHARARMRAALGALHDGR